MITPQVLNTLESICTINNTENRAFHKRKHKTVTDHIRFVCLHRIQEGTKKDSFSVVVVAAVVVPLSFVLLAECGGQSLCIRIRFCFENRMKIGLVSSRSGYFEVCIVLCVSSFFFLFAVQIYDHIHSGNNFRSFYHLSTHVRMQCFEYR